MGAGGRTRGRGCAPVVALVGPLLLAPVSLCCRAGSDAESAALAQGSRVEPLVLPLGEPPDADRLRLAAIFPTLGRYALSGQQSLNGARLAVDELNRAGGIHRRRLQLLEYRTGSYFVDAGRAAALADAAGALAIIGSNSSSLSMAVAAEAEARGLVQISNVSTAQELTWDPATGRARAYVFRVCSSDDVMGALLAKFARDRLHARRAAVLYEIGRAYSASLARSFIDTFHDAAAGRVTAEFFYLTLETDFRSQLRAVAEFHPDVLFVPGSFTDASLIAAQASALGLETTLLGADGWSNPLLFKRGGPKATAYFVDHCSPPEAFNRRYRDAFGAETYGCRAALAHDAVEAVATGLLALGPLEVQDLGRGLAATRRRLREAVARSEIEGATGRIRFDAHGDSRRGVAILAVERDADGRYRYHLYGWLGEP